jgi:hypothetical protein
MCSHHPATGCVTPFIKNPLPQQRASFLDRYPAAGLHATILYQVSKEKRRLIPILIVQPETYVHIFEDLST